MIVEEHTDKFVRGLIHSDGCRCLNRVNGRGYPRYFFSQVSVDIMELFCDPLDRLSVGYRFTSWKQVSIAHRRSVAILDAIVGPKT